MKRVKGVEDLNICIIGAQGIVGVGAITRTCIASFPAAFLPTRRVGFLAAKISSCTFACYPACFADCS